MAQTLSLVLAKVQRKLGDQRGVVWDDARAKGYIADAQDEVVTWLRSKGGEETRVRAEIASFPAGTTSLTPTSTPPLPNGFVDPVRLWEAQQGQGDDYLVPLYGPRDLPPMRPVDALMYYDFRLGNLYFIGATTNRRLRIEYYTTFESLVLPTDTVELIDCAEPIACLAAALCAESNENFGAGANFRKQAEDQMYNIVNASVMAAQSTSRRRAAYNPGNDHYLEYPYWR